MSRTEWGRRPFRGSLLTAGLLGLAALAHAAPAVLDDLKVVLPQLQPQRRAELQQQAGQWAAWNAEQRRAFLDRVEQWNALPPAGRGAARERYQAWQALPADEQVRVRAAARRYAGLPAQEQQELRSRFDALDRSERRGWLLGPELGADYAALQPLLAQVPPDEHEGLLRVLRAMTPPQRHDLSVLVQRTPPQERALLRSELVSTAAANRNDWLWDRLHR